MKCMLRWVLGSILLLFTLSMALASSVIVEKNSDIPIKERAELSKILKSVGLSIPKIHIYQLGKDISISGVKDSKTQFKIQQTTTTFENYRNTIILDENSHVIGLSLQGSFNKIYPLTTLSGLRWLILAGNNLKEVPGLDKLKSLQELSLPGNKISELQHLTLPLLRYLYLRNNKLVSIYPLSDLKALEYLDISVNEITDMSPLNKLKKLRYLEISSNPFQELLLSHLSRLRVLEASGKAVRIASFSDLPNLKELDLTNQKLEKIEGLNGLKRL